MLFRLQTKEEALPMSFIHAVAIEVLPNDISECFNSLNYQPIPPYLKRVKKSGDKFFILISVGSESHNIIGGITVNVPEFAPCTPIQFKAAREVWPCHYSNKVEDHIDQDNAEKYLEIVANMSLDNVSIEKTEVDRDTQPQPDKMPINMTCNCSRVCIICDGQEKLVECFDRNNITGHAILDAVSHVSRLERGYLCTGFDAYIYTEPCLSCAMALVHGRIKHVFCYFKKSIDGSFSVLQFNYNKHLNHRYNVYFHDEALNENFVD